MARNISLITSNLQAALVSAASAIGITINPLIWSKSDYKALIIQMIATQQAIEEQLYDSFESQIEQIVSVAAPQTAPWFQSLLINLFEYDLTANPVPQLDTTGLFPYYSNPNPAYNVIKFCSVNKSIWGTVSIKIAGLSGTSPVQLSSSVVNAAQAFVNMIGADGINYNVSSYNSDKIYIKPTIYFNGIYSAIIVDSIISAINNYLQSIPFNGQVSADNLLIAIKNVTGVNSVILNEVTMRQDSISYGGVGTFNMITSSTWYQTIYQTYAGYIIPETTSGYTLNDVLIIGSNLIAQ